MGQRLSRDVSFFPSSTNLMDFTICSSEAQNELALESVVESM